MKTTHHEQDLGEGHNLGSMIFYGLSLPFSWMSS